MGLKDLIFKKDENSDEEQKVEPVKETSKTKFPTAETTPTESTFSNFGFGKKTFTPQVNTGEVSPEHIAKAVERYQKGFESLNQPGFDFYEYYHTVLETGVDNAMAFSMAFKMGKMMDKSLTPETLISQAQFYETEIEKNYQESIAAGNAKKGELVKQKDIENQSLVQELGYMKEQLESLKAQILEKENKLKVVGSKYEPQINEIDSKLGANDIAKNQLIQSIAQVKNGININLK
jgi:hypothetical protein